MLRLVILFIALTATMFATTRNSDGSASDTQTQITASSNGDTVLLPASGSFTWSADVNIPATKAITLDLNGRTITLSGANNEFSPNAGNSGLTRVTNGNIVRGSGYNQFEGPFAPQLGGAGGLRIDHITFTGDDVLTTVYGAGQGLMDHCTFSNLDAAQEFMHIEMYGASTKTGWTITVTPGSSDMFFVEDCSFTTNTTQVNCSWIEAFYGSRVVLRYNTFDYVSVDMHGTATNIGARWWECYNNTFINRSGDNQQWAFSFRAGSGLIYNNDASACAVSLDIGLCEEDSGYPALWQIGRGISHVGSNPTAGSDLDLDPAYVWGNTAIGLELNSCDAPEQPNMVQLNRDVYASAKPGWTPYTYPHPYQNPGAPTPTASVSGRTTVSGKLALPP